jgi:hypothetical protein
MGLVAEVDLDGDQLGHGEEAGEEDQLTEVGHDVPVEPAHRAQEEQQRGDAQAASEGARGRHPVAATVPHDTPYRPAGAGC